MSLTKEQLCWVLIRLIGLYFLLQLAAKLSLFLLSSDARMTVTQVGMGGVISGSMLLDILLGIYFLFFGRLVHRLLMYESPPKRGPVQINYEKVEADLETQLMPDELVEFSEWLNSHPELKQLAKVDQVAKFRDSQRDTGSPED